MINILLSIIIPVALVSNSNPNVELTTVNLCDEIHAELTLSSEDLGIDKEAVQAIYDRCLEIM
jgi:hypothetical protein